MDELVTRPEGLVMAEGDESTGREWKEKYMALEALLFKFRGQMSVIRELTAEKMQQLETQVLEAEHRAYEANQQLQWMEERLKGSEMQSGDSELRLFRRCQSLQTLLQEKDKQISSLELQLEKQKQERIQDAKTVEDKAAKIKEWVLQKLNEFETQNGSLRDINEQQKTEIQDLKEQLQDQNGSSCTAQDTVGEAQRLSSLTFGCFQIRGKSPQVQTAPGPSLKTISTPSDQDHMQMVNRRCSTGYSEMKPDFPETLNVSRCSEVGSEDEGEQERSRHTLSCSVSSMLSMAASEEERSLFDGLRVSENFQTASDDSSSLFDDDMQSVECSRLLLPDATATSMDKSKKGDSEDASSDELNKHFQSQCLDSLSSSSGTNTPSPSLTPALTPKRPTSFHDGQNTSASPKQPRLRNLNTTNVSSALAKKHLSQPPLSSDASYGWTRNAISMLRSLQPEETDMAQGQKMETGDREHAQSSPEDPQTHDASTTPGNKPPTPPLHRLPSWESRIYAVAKSGIRLSEISCKDVVNKDSSHTSTCPSYMLYTSLLYWNTKTPVFTKHKGKATLTASLSSMASESDYAIPPDAYSTDTECSEPDSKLAKTSSSISDDSISESLEKSGYLLKMVKTWKRHWFVLKDGELLYYKSPIVTGKDVCNLKADSPNLLDEWLRVLHSVLRIKAACPMLTQTNARPLMKGLLTMVKHGHSKLVWCALFGRTLLYFRNQEDKVFYLLNIGQLFVLIGLFSSHFHAQFPLGQIKLWEARVEELNKSCDLAVSNQFVLSIQSACQGPTYLLIDSPNEKMVWFYHLSVAAGTTIGEVGTEFEKLIGKLLKINGDPESQLWRHPMLCFTKEGLSSPLTTLPSTALQTEAIKLFKTCQLFINVAIDTSAIDYHVTLAQCALQVCLTHPELKNEMYCQLIKQIWRRQTHDLPRTLQGWQFLALCVGLFLPTHPVLWYLQFHLRKHGELRTEVGKYAIYCERSLARMQQKGERQARSSRMEILSILLRNPSHHSLPFSVPVHFLNNTYQVVSFDASTTVDEFESRLNLDTGMRKTGQSGFSLYSDDPTGTDLEHCLQGNLKICDIISKWEQASKEQQTGKSENARSVKFTYKNRLYFSQHIRGETERERLLLAYQTNEEITTGHFPVNKELALEMAALLAQVEFGDFERPFLSPGGSGVAQTKSNQTLRQILERFYPKNYRQSCTEDQMRELMQTLSTRWASLRGRSSSDCIRIYLTVARKWTFFGAKLFEAESVTQPPQKCMHVWLAVHEDGVSVLEFNATKVCATYPHKSIVAFGACGEDFMLAVSQSSGACSSKERHLFALNSSKVRDLTLLIASYMNCTQQEASAAYHQAAPLLPLASAEMNSRSPGMASRPSKSPTLL
ncbi:hypothetical protein DNTS_029676 [Danionella cerebrum]|uniref:PH domain-containing protein n=1 Tax=Danionella cerebrum TaxID=2873325 RepID=A0A553QFQ4_9TELE|nr:hypothetical protein DNTS_029676 [Danionella translucida]